MKVDERTLERLADNVESFDRKLTDYEDTYRKIKQTESENNRLTEKVKELEARLIAPDYNAKAARAKELDAKEASLKAALKLEYEKGYAAAYIEVTNKMRA